MTQPPIIVRFAPSPTGFLHLGNARTAIFNWLYARHMKGTFLLRVEDTDVERSTKEAENIIFKSLKWLGLTWDEGPFYQSDRLDIYKSHVESLLDEGKAYYCYCTPDELEDRRQTALREKRTILYDGRCRDRKDARPNVSPTVRFRSKDEGATEFHDMNQKHISVRNSDIDDLIIMRADGTCTYNLTVVVDDHLMGITHVIRGADHLTNTPRQIQLYKAFGFPVPEFAHHGLILGEDKSKLSKRHGAVSVTQYRDMGFLPDALINALARIGWSHGDQEIFSIDELISLFDIHDVSPSPAVFDFDKLKNLFGQEHIKRTDSRRLMPLLHKELKKCDIHIEPDDPRLPLCVDAGRQRAKTMKDMAELLVPLFKDSIIMEEKAAKKHLKPTFRPYLEALYENLNALEAWEAEAIMDAFNRTAAALDVKLGKIAQPARVAVTGSSASPGIDMVFMILGKGKTLARLKDAISSMIEATL